MEMAFTLLEVAAGVSKAGNKFRWQISEQIWKLYFRRWKR